MLRAAAFVYRFAVGALLGAQIFFAAVAAPAAFAEARPQAGALVARMLGALDRAALVAAALAVAAAVVLRRPRAALPPLLAGLAATASLLAVTPAIHALRDQGQVGSPLFGK